MKEFIAKLLGTMLTWVFYWGVFLLVVIVWHKLVKISGNVSFIISFALGLLVAQIFSTYFLKVAPRILVLVLSVLLWVANIYLLAGH